MTNFYETFDEQKILLEKLSRKMKKSLNERFKLRN